MTTDIELLALAAKAAGLEWDGYASAFGSDARGAYERNGLALADGRIWNPLQYDGDALRLAAKLKIDLEWQATSGFPEPMVEAYRREEAEAVFCASEHEDEYRRAIVRAAAEIGRAIP